jgi:hypothetical protein
MLSITLDTDVVRDIWDDDERRRAIDALLEQAALGVVDLAVTRHIEEDVPHRPLADRIRELPELGIEMTGGVFVIGVSAIGGSDGLGSDEFDNWWRRRVETYIAGTPRLPGQRDYHHLHAHYIRGRDVFATWDKPILWLGSELADLFGMRVMTPAEALAHLDSITRKPS